MLDYKVFIGCFKKGYYYKRVSANNAPPKLFDNCYSLLKNRTYRDGSTSNVKIVEEIIPPVTTTESGYCISEPTPVAKRRGRIPKSVVNAVISTGLNLNKVAFLTISIIFTSGNFLRNSSINDTSTIPFSIAIAKMAINPTIAETLKYSPEMSKPTIPPMSPSGTPNKIKNAFLSELNAV